ncbi:SIS domain-containing protein [Aliivibrio fischeri]|uniref:SIS domain-containing protein n=1 Tax=Aliivibrio fischeri TaxID=668 RepID=UPI00084BD005|nr:SIS domain-containing protein [Aliivibrio fischeri]OED53040.1 hypothetical protein BEI47_18320 [Aliivibrio fischeri]
MNTMMTYIKQQPEILNSIANGLLSEQINAAIGKVTPKDVSRMRIVMVASGTSLNAAKAASERFSCPVECYYPYDFTMYNNLDSYDENTFFIFISQGGSSLSTYMALQHVKGKFKTLALVGDASKPIALEADAAVEFGCGAETVIYRTKGYTSSLLALCMISEKLVNTLPSYRFELSEFMDNSLAFIMAHLSEMAECSSWMVVGSGKHGVTSVEGALKLIETVRIPSMAFDLEEFIHGPQNAITETTRIVIIENFDDKQDKAYNLFRALRTLGVKAYLIGTKGRDEFGDFILVRPSHSIDEITTVIPLQQLSYLVSQRKGVDLTLPGFPMLAELLPKSL